MMKARLGKPTPFWNNAWVPTTKRTDISSISCSSFFLPFAVVLPVSRATFEASLPKKLLRLTKCCSARRVVGAMKATWKDESIANAAANAATTVFPEPTSPWTNLIIGTFWAVSSLISEITLFWASVNSKGKFLVTSLFHDPTSIKGSAWCLFCFLFKNVIPAWNAIISSFSNLTLAGCEPPGRISSISVAGAGLWIAFKASRIFISNEGSYFSKLRKSSSKSSFCMAAKIKWRIFFWPIPLGTLYIGVKVSCSGDWSGWTISYSGCIISNPYLLRLTLPKHTNSAPAFNCLAWLGWK